MALDTKNKPVIIEQKPAPTKELRKAQAEVEKLAKQKEKDNLKQQLKDDEA